MRLVRFFCFATILASTVACSSVSRKPASADNAWIDVASFNQEATPNWTQPTPVDSSSILNCEFRLLVYSPYVKYKGLITDQLYAAGTWAYESSAWIRFLQDSSKIMIKDGMVKELIGDAPDPIFSIKQPGRRKSLQMRCP